MREATAEARALDLEIAVEHSQLIAQRNLLLHAVHELAQQIGEMCEHLHAGLGLLRAHERHRGVERVEEKVRMQLRAQHRELRSRELSLELRRAQRLHALAPRALERVARDERHRVEHHRDREPIAEGQEEAAPRAEISVRIEELRARREHGGVRDPEENAQQQVRHDRLRSQRQHDPNARAEPENQPA